MCSPLKKSPTHSQSRLSPSNRGFIAGRVSPSNRGFIAGLPQQPVKRPMFDFNTYQSSVVKRPFRIMVKDDRSGRKNDERLQVVQSSCSQTARDSSTDQRFQNAHKPAHFSTSHNRRSDQQLCPSSSAPMAESFWDNSNPRFQQRVQEHLNPSDVPHYSTNDQQLLTSSCRQMATGSRSLTSQPRFQQNAQEQRHRPAVSQSCTNDQLFSLNSGAQTGRDSLSSHRSLQQRAQEGQNFSDVRHRSTNDEQPRTSSCGQMTRETLSGSSQTRFHQNAQELRHLLAVNQSRTRDQQLPLHSSRQMARGSQASHQRLQQHAQEQPNLPASRHGMVGPSSVRPMATVQLPARGYQQLPPPNSAGYHLALNDPDRIKRLIQDKVLDGTTEYDVRLILSKVKNGPQIIEELDQQQFIHGSRRHIITNALKDHLFDHASHVTLVTTRMREGMAVSFLREWPHMGSDVKTVEDRPWYSWYHPQNMGFLAHSTATTQRNLIKDGKGIRQKGGSSKEKVPRKLVPLCFNELNDNDPNDPADYLQDVEEGKNLVATSSDKANILALMKKTFERRRLKLHNKEVNVSKLLQMFPHFLSYKGEVIDLEFSLMHPSKRSNFLREFTSDFQQKILKIGQKEKKYEECFPYRYDVLNSIVVLAKFLGCPRRTYLHEEKMPSKGKLADFFHVVPGGSDPSQVAAQRLLDEQYPIQPYILCLGTPKKFDKMFLVMGEGKLVERQVTTTTTKALDLLLKTFFVANLHFPLGWKNVFRFLQVHIFHLPLENPRESSFDEKFKIIKCSM